jgi:DNA-binding NtrC family response regulator
MDLPSVLVVGSDPECRRNLADVLGLWGLESIFASTISEARNILLAQPIGLVFCESHLPDGGFADLLDAAASRTPPVRLVAMLHDGNEYASAIRRGAFEAIPVSCHRPDIQWVIIQATHAEQKSPSERLSNPEDFVQGSIHGAGSLLSASDPLAGCEKTNSLPESAPSAAKAALKTMQLPQR